MQAQAHCEGANVLTDEQWKRGQALAYGGEPQPGKLQRRQQQLQPKTKCRGTIGRNYPRPIRRRLRKRGRISGPSRYPSLDKLNQATPNPKQFWETLQNPIEGVTDSQRQAYAENWKKEVTRTPGRFLRGKGSGESVHKSHIRPRLRSLHNEYRTGPSRSCRGSRHRDSLGRQIHRPQPGRRFHESGSPRLDRGRTSSVPQEPDRYSGHTPSARCL